MKLYRFIENTSAFSWESLDTELQQKHPLLFPVKARYFESIRTLLPFSKVSMLHDMMRPW